LQLDPSDPTVYFVDGQPKHMMTQTVTLPPESGAAPTQHAFYSTIRDPVLSLPRAGLGWTAQNA
jgi:acyl-homoserine-lactone acylase